MTDPLMNESILELRKLIQMMDEDAGSLTPATLISDYVAPILDSMVSEIEMNRQAVIQTNDRVSLALMMAEKTFLGDILTSIAEHFSTVVEELPEDTDPESKIGVALTEIQDLLATWMSFELDEDSDDEDSDDEDSDDEDSDDEETVGADDSEAVEAEVITDAES
ncbi:MAG: hypothetical protein ACO39X_05260 [Candidatus Nanopelagicaceae bacterium]